MAAETALLDLVTPTQGTLTGTWGNTVNNGITEYVDIAIAGTLSLTGDGAVDLVNSIGSASATNITAGSTLAGAGTATAQFAVVKISGTSTTKTVTGPSTSKTYIVDNTGSFTVTFKASGQSGVSVVAGEKCTVYFNGTDYVKVASSTADGVSTISFGSTGLTPATATSGAVTVAGTLAVASGGTGVTTSTGSGNVVLSTSPTLVTPVLGTATSGNVGACTIDGTNLVGYKAIPQSGSAKTTSYTLATTDIGEFIEVGASGSIVVPNATFSAGDAVVIFNNTSGAITLTMSITTAYIGGTDSDKATISLATRGICNVLFISGTVCVVTGNVT
jgi:hypothetical protein